MISTVIISKNEEQHIQRCIESLLPVTDDIVLVDSGSTDNTLSIAQQYPTIRIIQHEWLGYSETKNLGNKHAQHDWILSIDSDECLSPELQTSIQALKLKDADAQTAFRVDRLNQYCGKWIRHSGWSPEWKTRLFNKQHTQWEGDIHEQLNMDNIHSVKTLNGQLLHYTLANLEAHLVIINKYTTLAAEELHQRGKRSSLIKAILKAKWAFIRMYLLKRGFLDGKEGFVLCCNSAYYTFLKWSKLWLKSRGGGNTA